MSMLAEKSILLISPEPWGECYVSKHHYAEALAKLSNTVYFLNPPLTKDYSRSKTNNQKIFEINYPGFPPGLRYFPKALKRYFWKRVLGKIEAIAGNKFDVVWSFDNSLFYDFSIFQSSVVKINHIVDYTQNFNIEMACKTADLCIGTTDYIINNFRPFTSSFLKIGHGFSPGNGFSIKPSPNVKLPGAGLIKALNVGNLSIDYIDYVLLEVLIKSNPTIDFIFAGPRGKSNLDVSGSGHDYFKIIEDYPNVFYLGTLPAEHISNYLNSADILFYAYKYQQNPEQLASPHKVLEYLSTGKPIIATWTQEYADKELIYMAKAEKEFLEKFTWIVDNYEIASSKLLVDRRINFALDNTYYKQLVRIEEALKTLNLPK